MSSTRFCSNCGASLNETANFCAACGSPVRAGAAASAAPAPAAAPAAAAAPAPAAASAPAVEARAYAPAAPQEYIAGVLPGVIRASGFLGLKQEAFIVVLTNLRVLFAAQTTDMMKENVLRARQEAEQQGKGFFGKWGAQMGANSGKHYVDCSPDQILAEQPANFYINRDQLRGIRLREHSDDETSVSTYTIEFDTTSGKQKFKVNSMNLRSLKQLLQQLYGNIVR